MEQKKQAKPAAAVAVVKVEKKAKPARVKHHARGAARAARREGLIKGWRGIKGAKQMAPTAAELVEREAKKNAALA